MGHRSAHPDVIRRVESYLRALQGPEAARTCAKVAEDCATTERIVMIAVAELRDVPLPIGSNERGYYWAVEAREVRTCANALIRRAIGQLRRGRQLRRAAYDLDGQTHIVADAVPVYVEKNGQSVLWRRP